MRTEKRPRLTPTGLAILCRAGTNPDGARLRGSGQQASARRLEKLGLGRFADCRPHKSRFYINDAGRLWLAPPDGERVSAFRRSAHARLVSDPRRGRLLLQLAYVADNDAAAVYDPYAWPREMPTPEQLEEVRELRELGDELAAKAARLGVRGGTDLAFRDVFTSARPIIQSAADRDHLVWEVASALTRGATLCAGDCEVRRTGTRRQPWGHETTYSTICAGVLLNDRDESDVGAAAAFVGERGAGVDAATAALERWEREQEAA